MPTPVQQPIRKRRDALRDAGLRPVQSGFPTPAAPASPRSAAACPAWWPVPTRDLTVFLDHVLADLTDDA